MKRDFAKVLCVLVLVACSDGAEGHEAEQPRAAPAAPVGPSAEMLAAREIEAAGPRAEAHADSAERLLRGVRLLTRPERAALRSDINRKQVARARALGIRVGAERGIQRLTAQGRLVALEDSTPFWVVEELKQSVPFLTPDAKAMLTEAGRRFHERLDTLGVPRFRMVVTSVTRTEDGQADLRRINANASRSASAHEFGTTLDVSHLRFAAPADPLPEALRTDPLAPRIGPVYAAALDSTAVNNHSSLGAVLGRVLHEMRGEGKLMVMMERQQAVYHMTVARKMAK